MAAAAVSDKAVVYKEKSTNSEAVAFLKSMQATSESKLLQTQKANEQESYMRAVKFKEEMHAQGNSTPPGIRFEIVVYEKKMKNEAEAMGLQVD
eukprot:36413-Eustigmatos_ZCMA.PRE.1